MATRKDLLDAFTYSRRRMISNVLQPSTTGTDESAPRPVRNFSGGIAVAIVLVLVFLLVGVFKGGGATAASNVLLLDKDTGGRYIVESGRAYPVANVASAKLMLGSGMTVDTVSDSAISKLGKTIGPTVGIPGLPDYLPAASDLSLKTWTVCTVPATGSAVNTVLGVGYSGLTPVTGSDALLIKDADSGTGAVYVVAAGKKFQIDPQFAPVDTTTGKVLTAFGFVNMNGITARDDFLATIPTGTALTIPTIADANATLPASVNGGGAFTKVGQYATVQAANGNDDYIIMTRQGYISVSHFVYALFQQGVSPTLQVQATTAQLGSMTPAPASVTLSGVGADWPKQPVSIGDGDASNATFGDICATTAGGTVTVSDLGVANFGSGGTSPQQGTSVEADTVYVKGGKGVIVAAGDGGAVGKDFLVTDTGLRYQLDTSQVAGSSSAGATSVSAQQQLGYDKVAVLTLPSAWISLIQEGPDMSPGNAHETEQVAGEAPTYVQ